MISNSTPTKIADTSLDTVLCDDVSVDSSSCNFALSPCGLVLFEDSTTTSSATTSKTALNRSPPSARRKLDGGMTRLFADKRSPLLPHKKSREFSEEDCLSVGSFQSTSSDCVMADSTSHKEQLPCQQLNLFRANSCLGVTTTDCSPIPEEDLSSLSLDMVQLQRKVSPTDVASFPFMDLSNTPVKKGVRNQLQSNRGGAPPPLTTRKLPHHHRNVTFAKTTTNTTPPPQITVSRFALDFSILAEIGTGSFGTVFKVRSRLDGCTYAIKCVNASTMFVNERQRLKEVHALAALNDIGKAGANEHIVRYHQAWIEDNRLYIQTELCTSTLQQEMVTRGILDDRRRYKLLREMLLALELIHSNDMVHLDIKPENIFIRKDQYKLGDFGLVSKITRVLQTDGTVRIQHGEDVEEGDSRYMSRELLSGDYPDLTKSDIFSLGATVYETCLLGKSLPANGQGWHDLRNGLLGDLPTYELKVLLSEMMHPDPSQRPDAKALLQRRHLLSEEQQQLIIEQNKVAVASQKLAEEERRLERLQQNILPSRPARGLIRRATWDVDTMNRQV